jgi:hypothetical protein
MNSRMFRRLVAIVALSALASPTVGCYGKMALTGKLYAWNSSLGDKWVKALVFFGLLVIPVYFLSALGDVLIFNTIEFWGGTNPLSMKEGEVRERVATIDGKRVRMVLSERGERMRIEVEGQPAVELRRTAEGAVAVDETGKTLASLRLSESGTALVTDAKGATREVSAAQLEQLEASAHAGPAEFVATLDVQQGRSLAVAK